MPDAAQYTLGLFDSTALGWTLDTPKAAAAEPLHHDDTDNVPVSPSGVTSVPGTNFYLDLDRALARGWPARARDNITAMRLSRELHESGRAASAEEQAQLLRFIGFGATELAQNCFPLPGAQGFRPGWEEIGGDLASVTTPAEYAALQRATQYSHYTPEPLIRSLWRAAQHLGFDGGRVLEPGMGTGLFFALLPEALRDATRLTGVEYDPITARIAALIHPEARVRCEDYTRSTLGGGFDLAIGNPPFADRIVRADPSTAALGLRLHDYFIARSISRLQAGRPGPVRDEHRDDGQVRPRLRASTSRAWPNWSVLCACLKAQHAVPQQAPHVVVDVLIFQKHGLGTRSARSQGGRIWIDVRAPAMLLNRCG